MDTGGELTCKWHGKATRIRCVTCDTPICPECAIRTPVGFKCPDHATKPAPQRRSPLRFLIFPVVILVIGGLIQLVVTTGRGEPVKPPCPTETAPDVGIGPEGGAGKWTELATSGLCGRYDAAVAWTGTEMLVWGGENCAGAACPSRQAPHLADGAGYRPETNAWRKLATSPLSARAPSATLWTGTEMIVWGGVDGDTFLADGAAYDPARDRWRPVRDSPLAPRNASMSVWTGREMIVWGGGDLDRNHGDGAAYDPATDGWRRIADSPLEPRVGAVAAWTGQEMLVWGGVDLIASAEFRNGAAYDPARDRWRAIAASPLAGRDDPASAWTGRELLVWGGNTAASGLYGDGAAYDPAADRWRPLPRSPLSPRTGTASAWSGRELLVWGGFAPPNQGDSALDRVIEPRTVLTPAADGAGYDPATNTWRRLESVALLGRGFPIAVWDGRALIVWGGLVVVSSPASASDGVRYTP